MSQQTLEVPANVVTVKPIPTTRPLPKRVMHLVRRLHLYFGLFLFPWALLYGATGFLFNHPNAFPDQAGTSFGPEILAGTPMESVPTPNEQAAAVVAALNEKQKPEVPYKLGSGDARYTRDFVFVAVKTSDQVITLSFDVKGGGGTVRSTPLPGKIEKAPFAVGTPTPRGMSMAMSGMSRASTHKHDAVKFDDPLTARVKAAVPAVCERTGFPSGEVSVTSAPELVFPIDVDGRVWTATYNQVTGSVSGTANDRPVEAGLSVRRFLLRLHLSHRFPAETNARWFWAVLVDAMAFVMCFWGVSGLFMWWQLKASRKAGIAVLLLSAAAAGTLGFAMHSVLSL